jgi:hypothetical protein
MNERMNAKKKRKQKQINYTVNKTKQQELNLKYKQNIP